MQIETLKRNVIGQLRMAKNGIKVMPSLRATKLKTTNTALMCIIHQVQGSKRSSARLCRVREGNNLLTQSYRRTLEIWQNSGEQRYRVDIEQWFHRDWNIRSAAK